MKKILLSFGTFLLLINLLPNQVQASTLICSQVDGMSIFGYNGSEWIHIGAIGSEFNSLSIVNEFGAGSKFKSTSIFNDFGKYGSEFSSQSAFNSFASKPPIIVNNNYKFVGYITINDYKTPNINTYEAIACAKNSFKSPNRDMTGITFKDIPLSISYGGIGYSSSLPTSCPSDSFLTATGCVCNSGYVTDSTKTYCVVQSTTQSQSELSKLKIAELEAEIKNTQNLMAKYCTDTYGQNSHSGEKNCVCDTGYVLGKENKCILFSNLCSETSGLNTYIKDGKCLCLDGYAVDKNNQCVTMANYCIDTYGQNIHSVGNQCVCNDGYTYEDSSKTCKILEVKKEIIQPVVIQDKAETKQVEQKVSVIGTKEKVITQNSSTTKMSTTISTATSTDKWYKKLWKFIWKF